MVVKNAVKLNVGGCSFVTKLSTLEKCNSPAFNELIAEFKLCPKDEVFVDRDGTYFGVVLNFLRTNKLVCPNDYYTLESLLVEAQYYQISELVDAVKAKIDSLKASTLVNSQTCLLNKFVSKNPDEVMPLDNSSDYSCQVSTNSFHKIKEHTAVSNSSVILDKSTSDMQLQENTLTNPFETPTLSAPFYFSESQDIEETPVFVQTYEVSQLGPQVFDATIEDF